MLMEIKGNALRRKKKKMRIDRLREMMTARGLTQVELAKRTRISPRQIAAYLAAKEKDRSDPTMTNAIAIATVLDCSLDWLAGLSDDAQGRIMERDLTAGQRRLLAAYRSSKDSFEKLRDVLATIASDEELMTKRNE